MESFIEKVKLWPCLWDTGDLSYRDIGKKDWVWTQLARECGMVNGKEAKSQWKKLRDSHREALRRRKTATGQPNNEMKPWKYEALMEFLLPQSENKSVSTKYSNDSRVNIHEASLNTSVFALGVPSNISDAISDNVQETSSSIPYESKDNWTEIFNQIKEQRHIERDYLKKEAIDHDRGVKKDALSNLFKSFCQKTRDLPKHLQLRVQREIFDSVSRAEEEAMSLNSNFTPMPISSTTSYRNVDTRNDQENKLPEGITVTKSTPAFTCHCCSPTPKPES